MKKVNKKTSSEPWRNPGSSADKSADKQPVLSDEFKPGMEKKRKATYALVALILLAGTIITYANHFNNGFHFDDTHTITNNLYIQNISNIPRFFVDVTTFGSMPNNLGYRPIVTASTAIDYWIGGGLKPFWFHMSMFLMFIFQGVLMFFMFLKIFNITYRHQWTVYLTFAAVGLYMLHPGNAETINYFCERADSFSTCFVILGFFLFVYSKFCRKYWIYTIPAILGVLSKQSAAMFPLLLFVYVFLFEMKPSGTNIFSISNLKLMWKAFVRVLPAFIITFLAAVWVEYVPNSKLLLSYYFSNPEQPSHYHLQYILTQPYVLFTYFYQFFIPIGLSSDPDINIFSNAGDIRMWVGFLFMAALLFVTYLTAIKEKTRPIAFGLLWFLIAAIPTSLLASLSQVANSHRLFYCYVGLAISSSWLLYLFILKIAPVFKAKNFTKTLVGLCLIVMCSYAYGTWQRNEVWENDDTLWADIIQKSPGNARALMNYGLSRMAVGDFFEAEYYYRKALALWPYWTYLHINMAILKNAQGQSQEAEQYFLNAIRYGGSSPEPYYYYARYLNEKGQKQSAIANLQTAIQLSSAHQNSRELLMEIYAELEQWDQLEQLANSTLQIVPNDANALRFLNMAKGKVTSVDIQVQDIQKNPTAEGYLSLSVTYYQRGEYNKCIEACNEALKLNPQYADAYNNICSAYNAMGMWDKGIEACEKALKIRPDFERASNNLKYAKSQKK